MKSALKFVAIAVLHVLAFTVGAFIVALLTNLPIIKDLLGIFAGVRADGFAAYFLIITFTLVVVSFVSEKMSANKPLFVFGIVIAALQAIFLVLNLIAGAGIDANIAQIFLGFGYIYSAKDSLS